MPAQVVVADLEASLDFYTDVLGLGLVVSLGDAAAFVTSPAQSRGR